MNRMKQQLYCIWCTVQKKVSKINLDNFKVEFIKSSINKWLAHLVIAATEIDTFAVEC